MEASIIILANLHASIAIIRKIKSSREFTYNFLSGILRGFYDFVARAVIVAYYIGWESAPRRSESPESMAPVTVPLSVKLSRRLRSLSMQSTHASSVVKTLSSAKLSVSGNVVDAARYWPEVLGQ